MKVTIHPHAAVRMMERGATTEEVIKAVEIGERFPAKYDRTGFRRNFPFQGLWRGRAYATKQIEAYAVLENQEWIVIRLYQKRFPILVAPDDLA
jgi:hypothetical protein